MPDLIESLETQISELHETMSDGDFYKRPGTEIAKTQNELTSLTAQLDAAFARWDSLESRNS